MKESCPSCGKPLAAGALAGLCAACLLKQAAAIERSERPGDRYFEPPPVEVIAKLFPELEILGLLGAGGMGAVYKARQSSLGRVVALKILPVTPTGGVNFAERFNREARALARLSHPNIVAVYEFGQSGDLSFFIMEFVDGANLRQLERGGRLSPREALQIIPQICDALQYAHDEGVVHRDIKPENVLVDRKGRVKIADFGLAKILDCEMEPLRLTVEGQVMGTPHYMAPEQVEQPLAVDHRADIYSLGVVFYEMLTGDLPLGNFQPPSRKVHMDVRLDQVVLRALENDRERRYQSASEVKSHVEKIVETPPPTPATSTGEAHLARWAGFPLLKLRGGAIAPNWKGILQAWAILFAAFTIVFGAVSVVAQDSAFAWLGVVGWPGVVVRAGISGLIVGFGMWSAVRRLRRSGPARTPQGTVIVGPEAADTLRKTVSHEQTSREWWWSTGRGGVTLATLCAIVVGVVAYRRSPAGTGEVLAHQIAQRDSRTGRLVATLPSGGKAELLAVGEPEGALDGWWLPDGAPITNATFEVRGAVQMSTSGRAAKELIFRVSDLPSDASRYGTEAEPESGSSGGGEILRDGKSLGGAFQMRFAWEPEQRRATVRIALGLAPWRTIATESLKPQTATQVRLPTDPNWSVNFHRPPDGATGNAHVSVVFGPRYRLWTHRIVAVDTNGVEHHYNNGQGTPLEKTTLWTYSWHDLPFSAVKEFQLQVRPLHWVEFRNIALTPGRPVPPPVAYRFGPVHEQTFAELIDFDTGHTGTFVPRSVISEVAEHTRWMHENGFDAQAATGELHPVGMDFVALTNREWDELTAGEAMSRFYSGSIYRPLKLRPLKEGELPATFAFRTREQSVGILQLVAFNDQEPGATVRFKLIQKPGAR